MGRLKLKLPLQWCSFSEILWDRDEMFLHAGFEGAKSGGLKTKLSDIIIITGLALIGSEGYWY